MCVWVLQKFVCNGWSNSPYPCSIFSAVFDDGDEKTLRRSSLCLKGARHFAESEVNLFTHQGWFILSPLRVMVGNFLATLAIPHKIFAFPPGLRAIQEWIQKFQFKSGIGIQQLLQETELELKFQEVVFNSGIFCLIPFFTASANLFEITCSDIHLNL